MANGGWYGTKEEWDRLEAPIKILDAALDRFADANGLSIVRNYKSWPSRAMTWGESVHCLIQIYLADEQSLGVNLWICASQDRDGGRYWKREFLCKNSAVDRLLPQLPVRLEDAKAKLDEWSLHPESFEFAIKPVMY